MLILSGGESRRVSHVGDGEQSVWKCEEVRGEEESAVTAHNKEKLQGETSFSAWSILEPLRFSLLIVCVDFLGGLLQQHLHPAISFHPFTRLDSPLQAQCPSSSNWQHVNVRLSADIATVDDEIRPSGIGRSVGAEVDICAL